MHAPIIDFHTHTSFSDGLSTFEENIRAAARAGCQILVASDHLTLPASMDPMCECQIPLNTLKEYRTAFLQAKDFAKNIAPKMEFVFGFECDWYPGCEENVALWTKDAQIKLGSVHWIGSAGDVSTAAGEYGCEAVADASLDPKSGWIDYSQDMHVWQNLGSAGVWRAYVDAWCSACESPLAFDSMAHPDLPMRFSKEGYPPPHGIERLWDEMAECARETGQRIEISSAALRKGLNDYYPATGLLERFCRANVAITFGSDAHQACDVCSGIAAAQKHAYDIGYRNFDVVRETGEWQTWEL